MEDKKYTMFDLDGKTYSVEDYLKQRDLFPKHDIVLVNDALRDITLKDLETTYRTLTGTFFVYEEDDGFWGNSRAIIKNLWFMVKEE